MTAYTVTEEGYDNGEFYRIVIGVYSTRENAIKCIKQNMEYYKKKPSGFCEGWNFIGSGISECDGHLTASGKRHLYWDIKDFVMDGI